MRTNQNEPEFPRWLLQLWNGLIGSTLDTVADGTVDIPEPCVCNDSLICDIFDNYPAEEMKLRVILSPKNADCLEINEKNMESIAY